MSKIKEAVGIFDNERELQATMDELGISGFDRLEMSVLGDKKLMKEKLGAEYKDPKELMDNPNTPRNINVTTEEIGVAEGAVIGGGILLGVAASLAAAGGISGPSAVPALIFGGAAGSALGGLMAQFIGKHHAERIQKQIEQGGLVLWVRTSDKTKERLAYNILQKHGAKDVHIHEIELEDA